MTLKDVPLEALGSVKTLRYDVVAEFVSLILCQVIQKGYLSAKKPAPVLTNKNR